MFLTRLKIFAAAAVMAVTGIAGVQAADPVKAGFVYIGPTGDHGWTYAHDEGRKKAETETGVKTSFVENVPETADAERVFRDQRSRRGWAGRGHGSASHRADRRALRSDDDDVLSHFLSPGSNRFLE